MEADAENVRSMIDGKAEGAGMQAPLLRLFD
jgi:hypothetical protein